MDHRELIEALGGYQEVAAKLGRHPTTVCRWQTAGIPPDMWPAVSRLAKRKRVARVSVESLERSSPLYGDRISGVKTPARAL